MIYTITDKNEIKKSLVEVQEILGKLDNEEYAKIPNDIKSYIKNNQDNSYVWEYDEERTLEQQKLNQYTLPILAYINTEFLLNDEQKEFMNFVYEVNDRKKEKELNEKYDSNNIFKKKI